MMSFRPVTARADGEEIRLGTGILELADVWTRLKSFNGCVEIRLPPKCVLLVAESTRADQYSE